MQTPLQDFIKLITPELIFLGFIAGAILSLLLFCIVVLCLLKIIGWLAGVDLVGGLIESAKREAAKIEAQDKDVKHDE